MLSEYMLSDAGRDSAWSLWVGGNLEKTGIGGKVQGRAFVRGDFTVESALHNTNELGEVSGGLNVLPDSSLPTLVVGGDISGSGAIKLLGDLPIQVGSNIASTVDFTDLGTVVTGGVDYTAADALRADLSARSRYWGSLSDTPGGSIVPAGGWSVQFRGDGKNGNPQMWVFNLTNNLTAQPVLLGFEAGDTILINCQKTGGDTTFVMQTKSYSHMGTNFTPRVLWNFPDATQVTIGGSGSPQGSILLGNPNSVTTISKTGAHQGRFVSCGSVIHTDGGSFYNYPFTGDLSDIPSIYGYLFIDNNNDQIRNSGDTTITNALVSLIAGGAPIDTTNTNHDGYYCFTNVPAGVVTVQVVQANAPLVTVPVTNDLMRNRATSSVDDTAVIEYTLVSGQTSEPLNFGYSTHPLSTALDLRVYVAADDRVMIEISTVNENGNNDIEIYAMINGAWTLVSIVPSDLIEGVNGNTYTVEAFGLTPGQSYLFKIIDESGHTFESGLMEVARSMIAVRAVTLTPNRFKITFASDPEMNYQVMVCEELGAPWKLEYVWYPTAKGWSKKPTNQPFTAAPGDKTEVLVPRNRAKAFFKVIQTQ